MYFLKLACGMYYSTVYKTQREVQFLPVLLIYMITLLLQISMA